MDRNSVCRGALYAQCPIMKTCYGISERLFKFFCLQLIDLLAQGLVMFINIECFYKTPLLKKWPLSSRHSHDGFEIRGGRWCGGFEP